MRIDPSKKVRHTAGEHIIIAQADGTTDLTKVIGLNESAMTLYERLAGSDFTLDDATRALLDAYEVDEATARRDAAEWIDMMRNNDLLLA